MMECWMDDGVLDGGWSVGWRMECWMDDGVLDG